MKAYWSLSVWEGVLLALYLHLLLHAMQVFLPLAQRLPLEVLPSLGELPAVPYRYQMMEVEEEGWRMWEVPLHVIRTMVTI